MAIGSSVQRLVRFPVGSTGLAGSTGFGDCCPFCLLKTSLRVPRCCGWSWRQRLAIA